MANWSIEGDYFETCNCDFLCPCLPSNMSQAPTHGHCLFALVFQVEKGHHGATQLDGLSFVVIGTTPDVMGKGGGSVGLILDERADAAQQKALTEIASGQAGGPMSAMTPLLPNFLGVERRAIRVTKKGLERGVEIPGLLAQGVKGVTSVSRPGEPVVLDNGAHPANSRLALAHATESHVHAFGLDWDDVSGRNNGHFAPFSWQG